MCVCARVCWGVSFAVVPPKMPPLGRGTALPSFFHGDLLQRTNVGLIKRGHTTETYIHASA